MGEKKSAYNLLVVVVAAIGSLSYGYSISILGNTLSKPDFYVYMKISTTGPGKGYAQSIIAAWNCLLYVGGMIGCCSYTYISKRFGRRMPISIGAMCVVVGGALQAGSVDPAMLSVARTVLGLGLGLLLPGVPLYQAEVAPPHSRGLMVGLHAAFLGAGTAVAQWVGVAFFHVHGQAGWRVPLALNSLFPLILFCLVWFLPESPRWLYMHGKRDAAEKILCRLHKDPADPTNSFAHKEMRIIQAQVDMDVESSLTIRQAFKSPSLRKRFIIGWLAMSGTQFSGLLVILTYQQVIYANLGFDSFMIGVMSGVWCTINGMGNFTGGFIVDRVGRKRQLIWGFSGCAICLIMSAILTLLYGNTDNKPANRAAIFFIFAIIACYTVGVEAPSFVYSSEIFPSQWRESGVAFSMSGMFVWAIVFTAVASPAFANIGAKFYIVFACTSVAMIIIVALFFPETKGYSLEQLATVFGDEVIGSPDDSSSDLGLSDDKEKNGTTRIETVENEA
ncbi:general substrate transporter [Lepidopterella palustris CBS 459.81]|uniref:General substrate transporter n=1 Tax=Lepidopterella palustris CBS 459.81 TaxID=1314670 RepID=A0A8E2EBI0_9PEZI|nr:general substrate transporter [Lepidopterella palustris CBS 459.81]